MFRARVGISKVFLCGQRAVSIIEEQRGKSGVLGTRVCTRLPVAVQVKVWKPDTAIIALSRYRLVFYRVNVDNVDNALSR